MLLGVRPVLGAGDPGIKQVRGGPHINPSLSEIGKICITGHPGTGDRGTHLPQ